MNRVVLFGASHGGENFLRNYSEKYDVCLVVDNDKSKQGMNLLGIPVKDPEEIHKTSYDYIIIASMYVESITNQLTEMGIEKNKIQYAPKNAMKVINYPFENPYILNCANEFIVLFSDILKNVRYFYTFGTLLGIVRNKRLIAWDDDIDIAIFAEDAIKVKTILLKNISSINDILDTKMHLRYYDTDDISSISIDCYYESEKVFNINFDCIYIKGQFAIQEFNKTPLHHFQGVEKYLYNNVLINIPCNFEGYLIYTYGDWKTEKKDTTFYDNTLSFIEPKIHCISETFYEGKG